MTRNIGSALRSLDSVISQLSQAAVSLLTTLTFVHLLSPNDFGILAAFWSIWMLLMSMNRAVFGEQLIAQAKDAEIRLGYLDFGFIWSTIGMAFTATIAISLGLESLIPGLICVSLFVVSDMVRYGEMAGRRPSDLRNFTLVPVELVRLALSGLAFVAALVGLPVYWSVILALTSSAVWVALGVRLNGLPRLARARKFLRRKEKFEGLMAIQFLTGAGVSQLTPFLALHAFGAAQFGGIRLAQSLLSPMTLLTSAFQPTLIHFYAARRGSGRVFRMLFATIAISTLVAGLMMLVALWGINAFGAYLIPEGQAEVVASILLPMGVLLTLVVVGQPGGALIKVQRMGAAGLWGQVVGACVTLAFCLLAMQLGIQAFVWALAVGSASTVLATYVLILVTLARSRNRPVISRVPDGNGI